ncbi:two component, sigma54 specific, transcriptional regulator, Fis family [Malonomonas rubra DSM 5091]|uniref:DNA-binding transcriptional regulator NtrC n=1 Tax=Malonomonas rubra DSM 5091 TaxID=1122189 RepID=A0A1M6JR31_MALRU|nr:sigma-54 dependent transcriptional regulator [Malonomonas rubra]SHJ49138.1 two component, sigma54 specific, transcriptional regulator, Fis family [Malonomonas rubra DSM 5091]
MTTKILICDDEDGMRRYLGKMLKNWGHQTESFSSPLLLLKSLQEIDNTPDLLLLDVKMPEMDGIEVLKQLKASHPQLPVIMMTGHGTIDSAVEAMKIGAHDYLTKPFPQEKLFALVKHTLEQQHLREENLALKKELQDQKVPAAPIFQSDKFRQAYDLALAVADSDSSVLVLGESGTGKELVAAAIHYASPRKDKRFLAINCAALSETLLESQLFGHVKGAFTGAVQTQKGLLEETDQGTLFLDEVGELTPALQAKLLRVLQEGEFIPVGATKTKRVDVRFVAATNKNLQDEVNVGNFRQDLFYRLNVISIELPPLRDRCEDIEPLAKHFLDNIANKSQRKVLGIEPEALDALKSYHWPGNVRELENVMERCSILARGGMIKSSHLPFEATPEPQTENDSLPLNLRDTERLQVIRALKETRWNKSRAAALLGVTRKTIDRKIKEFDLQQDDLLE